VGPDYRFSGEAGVTLGQKIARYDLQHAFTAVPKSKKQKRK
jgi:hypothetical protein